MVEGFHDQFVEIENNRNILFEVVRENLADLSVKNSEIRKEWNDFSKETMSLLTTIQNSLDKCVREQNVKLKKKEKEIENIKASRPSKSMI